MSHPFANLSTEQSVRKMLALEAEVAALKSRLLPTQRNPLLALDVYKMGHMEQYVPGCNRVYSYLLARSDKTFDRTLFFGLQYYLKQYLSLKLEPWMAEEFLEYRAEILGTTNRPEIERKIRALCELGYWPLRIKAVPEGTVMQTRNVLMTITNTYPDFYWCVGFIESLILKVWYPISSASCSYAYRRLVDKHFALGASESLMAMRRFSVHDFGYRSDASEEGAALSGVGHLLSFIGSDTVPALPFARQFYGAKKGELIMASVPATEHSVACSYGREHEFEYFDHMLDIYPTGIVSLVSDTYNIYRVLTEIVPRLKEKILARPTGSKVVFRPDSGNPEYNICGDPNADYGSPEERGGIRLLERVFGHTVNEKGMWELNPAVGLIYGDGMYLTRYTRTLERLHEMGYAPSNLIIGVGGILRAHSRDTFGFALKATYVEVDGVPREIEKSPITDAKKKSHRGLVTLHQDVKGQYYTADQRSAAEEAACALLPIVYEDGRVLIDQSISEIKERVESSLLAA